MSSPELASDCAREDTVSTWKRRKELFYASALSPTEFLPPDAPPETFLEQLALAIAPVFHNESPAFSALLLPWSTESPALDRAGKICTHSRPKAALGRAQPACAPQRQLAGRARRASVSPATQSDGCGPTGLTSCAQGSGSTVVPSPPTCFSPLTRLAAAPRGAATADTRQELAPSHSAPHAT